MQPLCPELHLVWWLLSSIWMFWWTLCPSEHSWPTQWCPLVLSFSDINRWHNDLLRRKVLLNLFPDWRGCFICKGEKNWDCRGKSELPHTSIGGLDIFRPDFGNRFWTPKVQLFQPPPRQMWLPQPLFSLVKTDLCPVPEINKIVTTVGIDSFVLCAILANYRRDLGIMLVKKNMITNSQHYWLI